MVGKKSLFPQTLRWAVHGRKMERCRRGEIRKNINAIAMQNHMLRYLHAVFELDGLLFFGVRFHSLLGTSLLLHRLQFCLHFPLL